MRVIVKSILNLDAHFSESNGNEAPNAFWGIVERFYCSSLSNMAIQSEDKSDKLARGDDLFIL